MHLHRPSFLFMKTLCLYVFHFRTFTADEPMNASVGLLDDGPCVDLDNSFKEILAEGFSYKAVDSDGNIVGATISGVKSLESKAQDYHEFAESCLNPKFQRILYVLAQREEGHKLQVKFPREKSLLEIEFASTDPAWRKRGIMQALVEATEKLAVEKGFKLLRMDTSSAYSSKAAERLGFTCIYKARYEDIKKDGKALLVPAPPHFYDCVYVKQLMDI